MRVVQFVVRGIMEAHTFGDSEAAEVLVKELENYPQFKSKVGSYWCDYTFTLNELAKSNMDTKVIEHLCSLFGQFSRKTINDSSLPTVLKTFLRNIMVKRMRQMKEE